MTYADKGLSLYALMNDMSDELINESDIRGCAVVKPKRERSGRFSAFMNHPAMVAVLCAVVSLGVLVAVVMAGREGPVTPPVGGTLYGEESLLTEESEASTLRPNISLEDFYASDVYVSYSPGYTLLHCEMIPERYVFQSANIGEEMLEVESVGFEGSEEQIAALPKVEDPFELLRFHVSETRRTLFVFIHDADMNLIHRASLDVAEPVLTDKLAAGVYYVSLHSEWENNETYGADEFVFALSLSKEIDSLKIDMVWKEETEDTLPSESQEPMTESVTQDSQETETRYEATEQVGDYTLIPHTPTAGINDNYFKISMTATEPGKALMASANYRLYRLHGDEEELIHDYDVELAVHEEPASPDDYAVYETGVSLVWAKNNLEAKGDALTPGWYRVKFARATLDFELTDETGKVPEVHPFKERPLPVRVYTSLSTEDMDLMEQYERVYTSTYKIEKLWASLTKLTVTEANPPEHIRSGDGLGIHVTYPDGTKGRIFFWGEQHEYFYIDDGPWYQAPPEEVAALMTQIKNLLSDPT